MRVCVCVHACVCEAWGGRHLRSDGEAGDAHSARRRPLACRHVAAEHEAAARLDGAQEAGFHDGQQGDAYRLEIGLYTILPSPIVYGVWHTKGRSVGGVYYAIVVQSYCNEVGVAGGGGAMKG